MSSDTRPRVFVKVGAAAYVDVAQIAAITWHGVYDCPVITLDCGAQVFAYDFHRHAEPTDKALSPDALREIHDERAQALLLHLRQGPAIEGGPRS